MYRRIVVALVVLCLTGTSAVAGPISESITREARTFAVSQAQAPANNAKIDWSLKVEQQKKSRHTGIGLMIGGGAGVVVGMTATGSGSGYSSNAAAEVIIIAGSAAVAIVGLVKYMGASSDLELLEREGKLKGYTAVTPASDVLATH